MHNALCRRDDLAEGHVSKIAEAAGYPSALELQTGMNSATLLETIKFQNYVSIRSRKVSSKQK